MPARSSSDRASHAVHTIPLISALALALIFSGCSEEIVPSSSPGATWSSDGAGTSHDPAEVQRQIQAAIPAAAGMPWSEYEAILERHGEIPNYHKLTNQPLSVVLGGFNEAPDVDVKELDAEFFVFNLTPRPDDVIASMSASREQGFFSIIQPDQIEEVTCQVTDDVARGQVKFTLQPWCRARVDYAARYADGAWQITEFALPHWQAKTELQEDGSWKASGEGLFPTLVLSLPHAPGLPPRNDSPNRMLLNVGYRPNLERPNTRLLSYGVAGEVVEQAELADCLPKAAHQFATQQELDRDQIRLVIRAHSAAPASLVQDLINQLQGEQFGEILLAGGIDEAGEFRTRFRLAPGEMAVSTVPAASVGDDSTTIRARLVAHRSRLAAIRLTIPGSEEINCPNSEVLLQHLMAHQQSSAEEFRVVFEVDGKLTYRHAFGALAAAAGYYNEAGEHVRLASAVQIVSTSPAP